MPLYDIQIGQVVTRVGRLVLAADDAAMAENIALERLATGAPPKLEDSHESDLEILSVELAADLTTPDV